MPSIQVIITVILRRAAPKGMTGAPSVSSSDPSVQLTSRVQLPHPLRGSCISQLHTGQPEL